ncbi:hypothetical protein CIPAW_13G108700 [Carya illinoinensis]|uniref:Uncharacterized protein n=1 Tax=Carya illinoinensis TaxID=32201 RepID=A0A8T1NS29_CARIL|nr:hypothetical protein CIPAW_13G108700 [Carya illinoinensis]
MPTIVAAKTPLGPKFCIHSSPSLTCKWGRNHTLNFLLLFDAPFLFFYLLALLLGILPNMTFLLFSIHPLPFLSCFSFMGIPQKYEFLTMI